MEEIKGTIKTIIYRNDVNGFTVLELVDESGDEITATGSVPICNIGERVCLSGQYTEHKTYGRQFRADTVRTLAPATLTSLSDYLGSGLIKGCGKATAMAIVTTFGMDTLRVLEEEPERLLEVPGIGRMRMESISTSFNMQREMRDIMLGLQEFGVTISQAMKLYSIYGSLCIVKIKSNPYRMIDDVPGIGFKTADSIAISAGIAHDSAYRLQAGLKYTLNWARAEGNTYLPEEKLVEVASDILGTDVGPVERQLKALIETGELVRHTIDSTDGIFLPYMEFCERDIAERLIRIKNAPLGKPMLNIPAQIERLEKLHGVELEDKQRKAVTAALTSGAMVITGGPGTGKTTILRFVIEIIEKLGLDFELCAPTGRAAKRCTAATGREARTIHRLLESGYDEGFQRNEDNPLLVDFVIVDEMSMVDAPLMRSLLLALTPGTRLIMVGDADQLPPVGAGNVLHDMIESRALTVIRLDAIFRQAGRSTIVTNAHLINNGKLPILDSSNRDFVFEQIDEPEEIISRVTALCSGKVKKLAAVDLMHGVQVLSPMKKGALGVHNLNARLQAALNPREKGKPERQYGDTVFRVGDKVMQIRNNYKLEWERGRGEPGRGVYNGDLGNVCAVDTEDQTVTVLFDDDRTAVYEGSMLDELELAYCISIHKSQGSEFPVVVLPLAGGASMLMTRNLLYTAVTRAVEQVYIVGRADSVYGMVRNSQMRRRYSALSVFLS